MKTGKAGLIDTLIVQTHAKAATHRCNNYRRPEESSLTFPGRLRCLLSGSGINKDNSSRIARLRNGITIGDQAFNMKGHRFSHQLLALWSSLGCSNDTRQVWGVRRVPSGIVTFNNDQVAPAHDAPSSPVPSTSSSEFFRPACLKILASVLGLIVSLGLPATTVTLPGFVGWTNWRWEPLVRLRTHPSLASSFSSSETFTGRRP